MADPTGFEPAISSVTGRRVKPLHYGSTVAIILSFFRLVNLLQKQKRQKYG